MFNALFMLPDAEKREMRVWQFLAREPKDISEEDCAGINGAILEAVKDYPDRREEIEASAMVSVARMSAHMERGQVEKVLEGIAGGEELDEVLDAFEFVSTLENIGGDELAAAAEGKLATLTGVRNRVARGALCRRALNFFVGKDAMKFGVVIRALSRTMVELEDRQEQYQDLYKELYF